MTASDSKTDVAVAGIGALVEQQRAHNAVLRQIAVWVVEQCGIPIDTHTDEPPPRALYDAMIEYLHEDPSGIVHGNQLDLPGVIMWVRDETGWWPFGGERPSDVDQLVELRHDPTGVDCVERYDGIDS